MSGIEKILWVIETGLTVGFFIAAVVLPVGLVILFLDRASKK